MPGQVLGRYELLLPIASGGMAMVWAARLKGTRGFQKIVAVKTMLPKLSEDEHFEKMFLDEASLASQIRHPHVVEILDLGEQEGVLFLVMEWIEGVPLNQLMKAARTQGGLPIPIAVRIIMQACAGLHAAHELRSERGDLVGLVHRDISPQNILVTYDGVAKVVDFGVAKATALGDGATVAGQIKGKVAYMAPEQVKGGDIDRRVDVFALGIVLYALTTGKHPFRRESEAATMYHICAPQPVLPPRKVADRYPPQLEAVVLKALAKDPAKRFQTANDMLRALDRLPSQYRASTDSEVAQFLEIILGDRRRARREALADAIERANQNPNVRTDWSLVEGSMPSGISIVSRSGSYVPGTSPTVSLRPSMLPQHGSLPLWRSRFAWALGGVAVALAGAVALAAYAVGSRRGAASTVDTNANVPALNSAQVAEPTSRAAAPETPGATERQRSAQPGAETGEREAAPVQSAAPARRQPVTPSSHVPSQDATAARKEPGGGARRAEPAEPKAPTSEQPEPPAKRDTWRTDPGF